MSVFSLKSPFVPAGDQPRAIEFLTKGLGEGKKSQTLLGITGSGKTFTMASVIEKTGRPALIMAHNKTLAAQIYSEMKELFPGSAVEYFVSYYDYYQPEAYVPRTDTYVEKDASINERIDLLRHSATRSLLERRDVIVVSSVSCIYGLGSPDLYYAATISLEKGKKYPRQKLLEDLVALQYERNDIAFERGSFRVGGENIDIFPVHYGEKAWKLVFFGDELENIYEFDPLTGQKLFKLDKAVVYAGSHFVTPKETVKKATREIGEELAERIKFFKDSGKHIEAQRIEQRTSYDMEMMLETGSCKGIENYSRFLTGSLPGEPPPTLFQYLPKDGLLFVDESHVTVPQVRAMYNGDRARKSTLVEYGFRLPSALDNRPLKFEEWQNFRPQTIFVSATPSPFEIEDSGGEIVEQIIRPTGLLDPECVVKPASGQVEDLLGEISATIKAGYRTLVTTLTKKSAEHLTEYLSELGYEVAYLHSEVHTLERIEVIKDLREGKVKILVGVNLLREGLDIPECALVAILDADKEGFLRSEVSLIQTIGRAARNARGRVVLYGDSVTASMDRALKETVRRRAAQEEYNRRNNIVPRTIDRKIRALIEFEKVSETEGKKEAKKILLSEKSLKSRIEKLRKEMKKAAGDLEFEKATLIRDEINSLEEAFMDFSDGV